MLFRIVALAVSAVLITGLFLLPKPDPILLGASQAGSLLLEPAVLPAHLDWREVLAEGDRVELALGREGEVRSVAGERVTVQPADGSELVTVGADEVVSLVEKRPLWRYLTEEGAADVAEDGTVTLRVRGYRMQFKKTTYFDQRLHARVFESITRSMRAIAAEHGFRIEFDEQIREDFPGVLLLCSPVADGLAVEIDMPDGSWVGSRKDWYAPDNRALVPPVVAILLALLLRRPLIALGSGVLVGAVLDRTLAGATWFESLRIGGARVVTRYLPGELLEPTRQQIVLFILFMLAMVGIITRAGGIRGLIDKLAKLASDARRCQVATFGMGLLVFFDHYANTILVGTTMRPLSDRFKVAREKLAYIVDSTAAPVAGISIFSTWIAFEVSTFSVQLPEAGMAASQGYEVFLRTMPYRFYSLFSLLLVGLIVFSGRDFGPMLRAERRARLGKVLRDGARLLSGKSAHDLEPGETVSPQARVALVPLATFLGTSLAAILYRGGAFADPAALLSFEGLSGVLFRGSGALPLMIGALAGLAMAAVQALSVGLPREIARGAFLGVRSIGPALVLLVLAWMIGAVCRDLGTASLLAVQLQESLNPLLLPILLFFFAGAIAFATGSSWSTMTILLPLVVGIAFEAGSSTSIGGEGMLIVAVGAVLEGAIFGDHCSPISDTTVMSSIASSSDHVDHVRTQAPYALLAMVVAVVFGYYPAVIVGLSPFVSLLLGAAVLVFFVRFYGKKSGAPEVTAVSGDDESDSSEGLAQRAA